MRGELERALAQLADAGRWKIWVSMTWDVLFAFASIGVLIGAGFMFARAGIFEYDPGFLVGLGVGLLVALVVGLVLEAK